VKPAKHPIAGTGLVILNERPEDAVLRVSSQLVCLEKEAALVAEQLGFNDQDFWKISLNNLHALAFQNGQPKKNNLLWIS